MPKATVYRLDAFQLRGWTAIARVQLPSGANISQAAISAITYSVQQENGTKTKTDIAIDKTTAVFDALQTGDARWTEDEVGFNFLFEIPGDAFPDEGYYYVDFKFTPLTGAAFSIVFEGAARSTL